MLGFLCCLFASGVVQQFVFVLFFCFLTYVHVQLGHTYMLRLLKQATYDSSENNVAYTASADSMYAVDDNDNDDDYNSISSLGSGAYTE